MEYPDENTIKIKKKNVSKKQSNVFAPVTDADMVTIIKKRRTPCKRGTRRNKQGDCVEYIVQPKPNQDLEPITATIPEKTEKPDSIKLVNPAADKKDIILDDMLAAIPESSNEYLRQKEKIQFDQAKDLRNENSFLYPDLDDPTFSRKIASKKEFHDTQYNGEILPIKEQAEKMCNAEFELLPHQIFVKNFLSLQTPYNSLLLYHGLGSGKTCSAIGIAEEMRAYMRQVGIKKRILIIASPNVQENFMLQLFDERRLTLSQDGSWTIDSCIGDSLLREVNPTNLKGISRERIIGQIKSVINQYYLFMGYIELSNYIHRKTTIPKDSGYSPEIRKKMEIQNMRQFFNNRLIIIDEVHNIRLTDENKNSRTAKSLFKLAEYCDNIRFLLLSATPMYNSYKEIVWLINLMNTNDKRATISLKEIFDTNGEFRKEVRSTDGSIVQEGGYDLLQRKMVGYVSYVRGENPYTFPYRIYPDEFSPQHTFSESSSVLDLFTRTPKLTTPSVPKIQLNNKSIEEPLEHLPIYVSSVVDYQESAYQLIIDFMRKSETIDGPIFEELDRFGFKRLRAPLEALNMVYPSESLDNQIKNGKIEIINGDDDIEMKSIDEFDETAVDMGDEKYMKNPVSKMVGMRGMNSIMNFTKEMRKEGGRMVNIIDKFQYKPDILEKYGRIFSQDVLSKYSSKISNICNILRKSEGIVMIYTEYIEGGIIPIALALEEMGITRFSAHEYIKPLFATSPVSPAQMIDANTMTPRGEMPTGSTFRQAKYVMITGNRALSPNNAEEIKYITSQDNKNGEFVKVVLISRAGSEGLDFKNIRQVHILEPWYNLNRIEQIIGRAVRNLSHCGLPFEKRNVEIYMHGSVLSKTPDQEAADVYVYRLAKKKADLIGRVTRMMKEAAVDCILNIGQTNFTLQKLNAVAENQTIEIVLSTDKKPIQYKIGDRAHTNICDYMESCDLKCIPKDMSNEIKSVDVAQDTYSNSFLKMNNPRIMKRIRDLFREQYLYKQSDLIRQINIVKQYPIEQIYSALTAFIRNKHEFLVDKYGRRGNLVNRASLYAFQPIEINDEGISVFERSVPIEVKRESLHFELPKQFPEHATLRPVAYAEISEVAVKQTIKEQYQHILTTFAENLNLAQTPHAKMLKGEYNWYKHASSVANELQLVHELGFVEYTDHIIRHMVDFLMPSERLILVSGMYNVDRDVETLGEIEKVVKRYLDEKVVTLGNRTAILLAEKDIWKLYNRPEDTIDQLWEETQPMEIERFKKSDILNKFIVSSKKYPPSIGFINMFDEEKKKEMVFRLKDTFQTHSNKGLRIGAGSPTKTDLIKRMNHILGKPLYTNDNSKHITHLGFCVMVELIMRQMTDDKIQDKIWFLNPEQSAYNGIVKYTASK